MTDFIQQISSRMQQLPGTEAQLKMVGRVISMPPVIPANARPGAVLCLLFPHNTKWHILLMKRRPDKGPHSGQVSFPGGRFDATDADYRATALREANEEVGIMPADVTILGQLTTLYIPVSNFNVYPFLAWADRKLTYALSEQEVEYIIEVPLSDLFHPERKTVTSITSPAEPGIRRKVNAYRLTDDTIIWGATAMILSEIEALMQGLH